MYHSHGKNPWSEWNGIWKYHTRLIPAGAAKLLIDQAIACTSRHAPDDLLALGADFENFGLQNKSFRIVRSYIDQYDDTAKVVAVYHDDEAWHLIVATERRLFETMDIRWKQGGGTQKSRIDLPMYPNEYAIESRMRAVY